jgi:predicted transcriptional regulator
MKTGGHTFTEIGEKIGVSAPRVCDYEAGRREISKSIAKKLSNPALLEIIEECYYKANRVRHCYPFL